MYKLLRNHFIAFLLSAILIPITGQAYNQTYNVKVGDTFTVYTTYHSDITAVLWTIPYDYVEPASYIGPAATSAKFRAKKEIPSGAIIQAVTYVNYHRAEVDDWLVCISSGNSGGGESGGSGLKNGDTFQYSSNGVNMKFKVISATDKTCMVGTGGSSSENVAIAKSTNKESVIVPEYANGFKVVEVASCAFYECKYVETFFLPSSITKIRDNAFGYCSKLKYITVPNSVTFIDAQAFGYCTNLREIVFGSSVTEIGANVISGDTKLETITSLATTPPNVSSWTFFSNQSFENNVKVYVPKESLITYRNTDCWNWFSVQPIGGEDDSKPYAVLSDGNTKLSFFYDSNKEARGGMDVGPFNYRDKVEWYNQRESITTVVFDPSFADCDYITSTAYWFYGCKSLTEIYGMENLNTANVTYMYSMFNGCISLMDLDVSNFNTSNVTHMYDMFYNCESLTTLDLSNFNTSNVLNMGGMFFNCKSLTSLDLSNFNTEKVTDMSYMFKFCSSLTNLIIRTFITSNVTEMNSMFEGCKSLTNINLSNFNTANVTRMDYMFQFCSSLTSLDVSNFNTSKVESMSNMFQLCSSLTTIYSGDRWRTEKVRYGGDMFMGCTKLVGGAGTAYDAAHADYTYAHIDGGMSNPGYFTDINSSSIYEVEYKDVETTHATFSLSGQRLAAPKKGINIIGGKKVIVK